MRRFLLLAFALIAALPVSAAVRGPVYSIDSPSGKLTLSVDVSDGVSYSLAAGDIALITDSPVSMTFADGTVFGAPGQKVKPRERKVSDLIDAVNYRKAVVKDEYTELVLPFSDHEVQFRLYDDGAAWRFVSMKPGEHLVRSEQACFNFAGDWKMLVPYVQDNAGNLEAQRFNSFENTYSSSRISEWDKGRLAFAPMMVRGPQGINMVLTESDLLHYPGMMFYNGDGSSCVTGDFARYPRTMERGGHNGLQMIVKSREDYIARVKGERSFPWRIIAVSFEDKKMLDNDIVYRLASPKAKGDFSWVRPGKVAWDWWNDWNIRGVDFKAGINNDTYKYYIDFASSQGIEYVILDEGWSVNGKADLFQVVPEIDIPALVKYASSRGVGLILWAGYWAFSKDMAKVCKHYSEMGIKGFKVDFMDRDDQIIEGFLENAAATAARYHLVLDFHGIHKPTGLARKYPNVLNYEGVFGLEQMKWGGTKTDMVEFDVTLPYIRFVAGPADYTQGAMRNAAKDCFRPVNSEPMSQGTRCHQLAEYVVFDSPLNMLCDSPSNYMVEPECTGFIAGIPTVWDETAAVDGKVSEYVVVARRSGDDWYLGAMTNWTERDLTLYLGFLGGGEWVADVFKDGVNADKAGCDYKRESVELDLARTLKIHLAPGGGCAIHFRRE